MTFRSILAGSAALSLMLSMVPVERAYALSGTDPNQVSPVINFRKLIKPNERYQRNKRAVDRNRRKFDDGFTTGSGSVTNYERRKQYLRETQQRRIQEDLDAHPYSGRRRGSRHFWDREDRSPKTTQRRIKEAEDGGGVRLRRGSSSLNQLRGLTPEQKAARIKNYRNEIKEAERGRYIPKKRFDCDNLRGRRRAKCYHGLRQ